MPALAQVQVQATGLLGAPNVVLNTIGRTLYPLFCVSVHEHTWMAAHHDWVWHVPQLQPVSCMQHTSHPSVGHLMSTLLLSLIMPRPVNDKLKELCRQLSDKKRKLEKITCERSELESKLKNLSQAFFKKVHDFPKCFP